MRVIYLYDGGEINKRVLIGIDHKVFSQVKAFRQAGIECDLVCPQRRGKLATVLQSLPFFRDRTEWNDTLANANADVLYIRRPVYASKQLIESLKALKRRLPSLRVIYEIPTWPYDKELSNPRYFLALLKDRYHRRQLNTVVDRIVDLSNTSSLFGIPTIQIQNGIDLDVVRERRPSFDTKCINLIFVALFSNWHGADRIIEGLRQYRDTYRDINIVVHFVGEGPEYKSLVSLVSRYELNDFAVFHGNCTRNQMDKIYDSCTFGIASLGLHRIGLNRASTLKTREYLAKGLPFLYSGDIQEFEEDPVDFCLKMPANDSAIDIHQVIEFYRHLYMEEDESSLIQRIRLYAENHVGMSQTMRPVIDYIKNGEDD